MKETIKVHEEQGTHGFGSWVREHKKAIIAGTCLVVGTVAGVIIYKKIRSAGIPVSLIQLEQTQSASFVAVHQMIPDAGIRLATESATKIAEGTLSVLNGGEPFDVSKHVRNLSGARTPSAEKIRTALENGFELGPNQTWVDHYIKNRVA